MMKIFVKKNDSVDTVVEYIIAAPDLNLVLVIPRFSKLGDSATPFHRLKKEAEAVGKRILVESVDEHVLTLAKDNHIESVNPFFGEPTHTRVSDIVRRSRDVFARKGSEDFSDDVESHTSRKGKRKKKSWGRRVVYGAVGAVTLSGLVAICFWVLPKAEVILTAKKGVWEYHAPLLVDKAGTGIAGQIFSKEQNQSFSFPATGTKNGASKATGVITIYNDYSAASQYLVATTRFAAPDGKIFRLNKGVTVPGAKVVSGKLTPSSIAVEVTADQAGPAYNLGPVEHFTIPGFQGTPRYDGFYGESKNAMAGGAAGNTFFATAEDIKNAKQVAQGKMKIYLQTALFAQIDSEFRVVASSSRFTVIKENPIEAVASDGTFSVFLDAKMDVMAFREEDAVKALTVKAQQELGPQFKLATYDLSFGSALVDFATQKVNVPTNFKGNFAYDIDTSNLKSQVAGKNQKELGELIQPMPGVERATLNLWPFWVFRVPANENKIKVTIQ